MTGELFQVVVVLNPTVKEAEEEGKKSAVLTPIPLQIIADNALAAATKVMLERSESLKEHDADRLEVIVT